jgi:nucleoside-diphosphate-sugar epimerase
MTMAPVNAHLLAKARDLAVLAEPERPTGLLVLGGGYCGRRLARVCAAAGIPVTLTRRPGGSEMPPARSEPPLNWLDFDGEQGVVPELAACAPLSHVLVTIPPDGGGEDPCIRQLLPQLQQLPLHWLGYLSTTGVYGDCGGRWVDEEAPTRASQPRSMARLASEAAWRRTGLPVQIFRLPAIYGPHRCPFQALAAGRSRLIHKPGQVFSRIHVDDIVGAVLHNLALPPSRRPALLNVADDHPCPSSESLAYAAHLARCPLPAVERYEEIAPQLSPMALGFWQENRRASNRLLCAALGYQLLYPSYREGFQASWQEEQWSP